jgi:fatty-acyl-CoA synthase
MVSLSAGVAWWARTEPQRTALLYGDAAHRLRRTAAARRPGAGLLAARGIRPGDMVALLMKNSAAFVELALAVSHAGAVLLPINYRLGADEVATSSATRGEAAVRRRRAARARPRASDTWSCSTKRRRPTAAASAAPARACDAAPQCRARRPVPADVHLGHDRPPKG